MHKGNLIPEILENMKITTRLLRYVDFLSLSNSNLSSQIVFLLFSGEYINCERCSGLKTVVSSLLISIVVWVRKID